MQETDTIEHQYNIRKGKLKKIYTVHRRRKGKITEKCSFKETKKSVTGDPQSTLYLESTKSVTHDKTPVFRERNTPMIGRDKF